MAELADPNRGNVIRSGARATYPWATWCNGAWWRLYKDVDYTTETKYFQNTARNYAKRNGLRLEVKLTVDGTFVRFTPKETEPEGS